MPITSFQEVPWLSQIGERSDDARVVVFGSAEELSRRLEDDPDAFFAPPYADPYESLCVADHAAAAELDPPADLLEVTKRAHAMAWAVAPVPELAGLVHDDADTLYRLHHHLGLAMPAFAALRLQWYARGRVPWGYAGDYPKGRLIVL